MERRSSMVLQTEVTEKMTLLVKCAYFVLFSSVRNVVYIRGSLYLRAGNLLMLFATLINIRAPFKWSPRFTCSWNKKNRINITLPSTNKQALVCTSICARNLRTGLPLIKIIKIPWLSTDQRPVFTHHRKQFFSQQRQRWSYRNKFSRSCVLKQHYLRQQGNPFPNQVATLK